MKTLFQPQLPACQADESDVTLVIESVDDLLHHADLTDEQEEDIRRVLARARNRLFKDALELEWVRRVFG